MSGGSVKLVATGPQDAWLTGKPEVSFYRSNYRRSTHYSNSVELQVIQGTPAPGNVSTIRFEKKGDLLSYVYLTQITSAGDVVPTNWSTIISRADLYIGGQLIDSQNNEYNAVIEPVTGSQTATQRIQGLSTYSSGANITPLGASASTAPPSSNFYPFKFFFCKDWSTSLPLIGLQFHDVEIRIQWNSAFTSANQFQAWANFVYLDQVERDWFANNTQDILITQVQKVLPSFTNVLDISLAQPVKFLAFKTVASPVAFKTQVNGVDIGDSRSAVHWSDVTQYYHTPYGYNPATQAPETVVVIPYCLDTSKLQPTGTLNFSRLDSYRIIVNQSNANGLNSLTPQDQTYHVLGVNYNILRIQNGLGSVLYAS